MRELSYAEALREGMRMAMEKDPSVFVIGEDIGVYGGAFGVTAGLMAWPVRWRSPTSWSRRCGRRIFTIPALRPARA